MATESTPVSQVPALGAHFNFAQHLIDCNAAHPARTAYIDDTGSLSYGELAGRIRRLAAALLASGVRREERVLLLMHDCSDWPVSFLGAMYAGIVPVAVNTLLTTEDYAFMLEHSRAQAVLVSGALLPMLQDAMAKAAHEVKTVIVSQPQATGCRDTTSTDTAASAAGPGGHHLPRRSGLLALLFRLHRPPQGHPAHAGQSLLDRRTVRQARAGSY